MKSKKIVYFDQSIGEQKTHVRRDSTVKKNLSAAKVLRQASANKSKNISHSSKLSNLDKGGNSQKIKVFLIKDGFIFQKKYIIYDIQCMLVKKQVSQRIEQKKAQASPNSSSLQQSILNQQDYLFLNLEACSIGVTKGSVRHNFPIQKDISTYIQIKIHGFNIENITISNKKIQYVTLQSSQMTIDEHQITTINPIKSLEQSQQIRLQKIKQYFINKSENRPQSKSLNICWPVQTSIQNAQSLAVAQKPNPKKIDIQSLSLNNPPPLNTQINTQIQSSNTNRQTSKAKRISNTIMCDLGSKTSRQNIQKVSNLSQFMKCGTAAKQIGGKPKTGSRKVLNDSNISNISNSSMTLGTKIPNKEIKRQDAYGLQEISRKSKSKYINSHNVNVSTHLNIVDNFIIRSEDREKQNIIQNGLKVDNQVSKYGVLGLRKIN